jgi:tRNA 2-thiouridine synthesizing protein A
MPDHNDYLDVTGLLCPLPVLKARKRLKDLAADTVLKVDSSDPASVIDFPHFCNESGHALINHDEHGGIYSFWIRKK